MRLSKIFSFQTRNRSIESIIEVKKWKYRIYKYISNSL